MCKTGSTTLLVSSQTFHVQKSWSTEERCTAVFFESVMVICVYALDSAKETEEYEKSMPGFAKVMMLEGCEDNQLLHEGDETERRKFKCT